VRKREYLGLDFSDEMSRSSPERERNLAGVLGMWVRERERGFWGELKNRDKGEERESEKFEIFCKWQKGYHAGTEKI
jgi:hypothetical protein